jgi:hypothetical protein
MRKERCKDGKKYMLIGRIGMFGPSVYWGDNIKDFRVCDLEDIKDSKAALFAANDGKVVRIKTNGTKWHA